MITDPQVVVRKDISIKILSNKPLSTSINKSRW